jgi:hypothetical protein
MLRPEHQSTLRPKSNKLERIAERRKMLSPTNLKIWIKKSNSSRIKLIINSTTWLNMKIQEVAVNKLIPYAKNSRTHSDQQVAQIAASIKEFGFRNPILVDGVGVIAGHGRLLAAQKLGLDKVPTIDCSDMTESQKKAYIIADNKLALNAGWDNDRPKPKTSLTPLTLLFTLTA